MGQEHNTTFKDTLEKKMEQLKSAHQLRLEREKSEENAKILGTAMEKLLPDIFIEKRAIPNSFLRGALFGLIKPGKRVLVGKEKIFTMSQYDLSFSGYRLDQNDLELWDTLMYLAKRDKVQETLKISLYELLKIMSLSNSGQNRKAIKARLERLKFGMIQIKKDKIEYGGSLIDSYYFDENDDGKLAVRYNKELSLAFKDDDFTLVNVDIYSYLGENQLAKWLYNFYESHNIPMPFELSFIQKLCHSETEPKGFKRILKNALTLIQDAKSKVNSKSKWEWEITRNNYLFIYPNGKAKQLVK